MIIGYAKLKVHGKLMIICALKKLFFSESSVLSVFQTFSTPRVPRVRKNNYPNGRPLRGDGGFISSCSCAPLRQR